MEEQVKNIISKFIKVQPAQISSITVIDRSAVTNSIVLHRMYAQLSKEGFAAQNYSDIKTFGELMVALNNKNSLSEESLTPTTAAAYRSQSESSANPSIGIDAEAISAMPIVSDFRDDQFYKMNFSSGEIAHCILQTDPYSSFAGLFAVKEAIVKADNTYKNKPFSSIVIDHLPEGKPVHPDFNISISHTKDLAIAVAVKNNFFSATANPLSHPRNNNFFLVTISAVTAFLLSLLALLLVFFKSC